MPVGELMAHVLGLLLLAVTLGVQEVREEKQLDDDEENEQLDADDEPQRLAHSHAAESVIVQVEYPRPETLLILLVFTHKAPKG